MSTDIDVALLQFGEDFDKKEVEFLTMSEVKAILKEKDEKMMEENPEGRKEVFEKALLHVDKLAPDVSAESAKEMKQLLINQGYHPYEAVQMINLDLDDAEEARSLIPTLKGISDENEITRSLEEMRKVQDRQS